MKTISYLLTSLALLVVMTISSNSQDSLKLSRERTPQYVMDPLEVTADRNKVVPEIIDPKVYYREAIYATIRFDISARGGDYLTGTEYAVGWNAFKFRKYSIGAEYTYKEGNNFAEGVIQTPSLQRLLGFVEWRPTSEITDYWDREHLALLSFSVKLLVGVDQRGRIQFHSRYAIDYGIIGLEMSLNHRRSNDLMVGSWHVAQDDYGAALGIKFHPY